MTKQLRRCCIECGTLSGQLPAHAVTCDTTKFSGQQWAFKNAHIFTFVHLILVRFLNVFNGTSQLFLLYCYVFVKVGGLNWPFHVAFKFPTITTGTFFHTKIIFWQVVHLDRWHAPKARLKYRPCTLLKKKICL